jgi:Ca-activated chloride channel homolog
MSCGEIQVRLADDVLGEVGVDHDEVAAHLAGCAVCAEERRAFEEAIALLREMDWPVVEPVLAAPQRERVEARAAEPQRLGWPRRRQVAFVSLTSLAAAAVMAWIAIPGLLRARVSVPAQDLPEVREARQNLYYEPLRTPASAPPSTADEREPAKANQRQLARFQSDRAGASEPPALLAPPPPASYARGSEYEALRARRVQDFSLSGTVGRSVEGGVPGGVLGGVVGGVDEAMPVGAPDGSTWQFEKSMPAPDMFFQHQGTNPFVATEQDPLSTFGLDVDTASYTVARNYITRGELPPASAVRVEEFVNALPADYAPPRNEVFAIHVEAAPSPFRRGYHLLRVGLKARVVRAHERKRANLTFVIDVSGSMAMENRLGLVQRSLRLLVDRLDDRDRIGIVVYGTSGRVVLDPTPASDRRSILRAIDSLRSEGSTNLEEGLDLGYRMAVDEADPAANNRVVLCTDGVANNGVTDATTLLKRIHARAQKRVFLTALGFGMGNYNDALLQRLADEGDGQYAYIDDDREAERFFLRDLSGVLEVVARDAKAQVQFDPAAVASYRLLGYEKRDVADEDFRNDDVDGGEIGAGHAVTVLYELKLRDAGRRLGTVNVRFIDPESGDAHELARDVEDSDVRGSFEAASPGFRVAAVMARFAEHLRQSYWLKGESLEDVLAVAERLPARAFRDTDSADVLDLMRQAVALSSPRGRLVPVNRDR